jgi:hypothetical protein
MAEREARRRHQGQFRRLLASLEALAWELEALE